MEGVVREYPMSKGHWRWGGRGSAGTFGFIPQWRFSDWWSWISIKPSRMPVEVFISSPCWIIAPPCTFLWREQMVLLHGFKVEWEIKFRGTENVVVLRIFLMPLGSKGLLFPLIDLPWYKQHPPWQWIFISAIFLFFAKVIAHIKKLQRYTLSPIEMTLESVIFKNEIGTYLFEMLNI